MYRASTKPQITRPRPKHLQYLRGGGDSQKLGGFLTSEDGGGAVRFFPRRCYNSSNSIRIVRTPILNSSGGTMKTDGLTVLGHVHSTSQNPTATCMCACERART